MQYAEEQTMNTGKKKSPYTKGNFSNSSIGSGDMNRRELRIPPHSIDAEQAVLGSIMLRSDILNDLMTETVNSFAFTMMIYDKIVQLISIIFYVLC